MFGPGLNGLNELSLLKTTTVVGIGGVNFILENRWVKTSRNCSRRTATCRISLSLPLPIRKKFFDWTLVQVSLATTSRDETVKKTNVTKRSRGSRFISI